jgi:outer membrane protein assembly factor BamB
MRRPIKLKFVHLAAVALLSGCGMFGSSDKKLGPLPEIASPLPVKVVWQASGAKSGGFAFTPAAAQGVIFAAGSDGTIIAMGDGTGRVESRIDAGQKLSGGVGYGDGKIVVGTFKGDVLAFDNSGRSLWKSQVAGEVLAAPTVLATAILVRTADGRIFALNPLDGRRRWAYQRATPALTLRSNAGVVVSRGTVYAGFAGGKLVAIEIDSGKPIWEATLSLPRGATELERVADVGGIPVLDDTRICAAVYQGRSGCVETLNGNVLWSREISSAAGVAVDGRNLYLSDDTGNVIALDKVSGASVWKQDKLAQRRLGTPVTFGGKVWVGDGNGLVHVLAADNGALVGRVATDGSAVNALLVAGEQLIAQSANGGIFAIR